VWLWLKLQCGHLSGRSIIIIIIIIIVMFTMAYGLWSMALSQQEPGSAGSQASTGKKAAGRKGTSRTVESSNIEHRHR